MGKIIVVNIHRGDNRQHLDPQFMQLSECQKSHPFLSNA